MENCDVSGESPEVPVPVLGIDLSVELPPELQEFLHSLQEQGARNETALKEIGAIVRTIRTEQREPDMLQVVGAFTIFGAVIYSLYWIITTAISF